MVIQNEIQNDLHWSIGEVIMGSDHGNEMLNLIKWND